MYENSSEVFRLSPTPINNYKCLIVTSFTHNSNPSKLPLLYAHRKSPRKIPKEYLFSKYSPLLQISKTPLPFQKKTYKYSMPKDFISSTLNRLQHKPLVLNLTPLCNLKELLAPISSPAKSLKISYKENSPICLNQKLKGRNKPAYILLK